MMGRLWLASLATRDPSYWHAWCFKSVTTRATPVLWYIPTYYSNEQSQYHICSYNDLLSNKKLFFNYQSNKEQSILKLTKKNLGVFFSILQFFWSPLYINFPVKLGPPLNFSYSTFLKMEDWTCMCPINIHLVWPEIFF